jgi:endonuclease YncB( thermonuclease family)
LIPLRLFLLVTLSLMPLSASAYADDLVGHASVIDADTVEIHGTRIRLHGIDAPEKGQLCVSETDGPWRCGQKGAFALADFVGVSAVVCHPVDVDRYGRVVADCKTRDQDLNEWIVREGWAMAYARYLSAYVGAEQDARAAKRGIWSGYVQPPWEWRLERRH